ncbi:MAG: SAM-dependent chlorinase/fluorinase, partial [Myxococcota bacterium]|nr:SAM-dependent chlorinase/fluorinase [Myxococcota bacterium]
MPSGILTFLTDFGRSDAYVAAMKGVALQRAPELRLVDISHEVPPQDVHRASYLLSEAAPWFPPGTVHVVVVDPGVGTDRKSIVAVLDDQLIVTPDNGTVSRLFASSQHRACFELTHPDLGL